MNSSKYILYNKLWQVCCSELNVKEKEKKLISIYISKYIYLQFIRANMVFLSNVTLLS